MLHGIDPKITQWTKGQKSFVNTDNYGTTYSSESWETRLHMLSSVGGIALVFVEGESYYS